METKKTYLPSNKEKKREIILNQKRKQKEKTN